jgi:hypothetical protein
MCRTEKLKGHDPQLRPPFDFKWIVKYFFKHTPYQGGLGFFRDHFENLHDQSITWMSYATYHDDLSWTYHLYYNLKVSKIN